MQKWREQNHEKDKAISRKSARHYRHKTHMATRPAPQHCECCGAAAEPIHLDHDHVSDKFRGWLCTKCNVGIGMLGDKLEGVLNAVKYLERNG